MKRTLIIIAAAAISGAALAADQPKDQPPYNYGATPPAAAPMAAPSIQQATPPPDGRQFNYEQYKPKAAEPKPKAKAKAKPERKRQVAHHDRKPFNYDARFIDNKKVRRCIKELPWKGLLKEHDSPEGRKEFCRTYQIEMWASQDQKKVKAKLEEIFGQSKTKPKPKPQYPQMGD